MNYLSFMPQNIKDNFDSCENFEFSLIKVEKDNKFGILNSVYDEIIPCIYDEIISIEFGLIKVKKDNKYGLYYKFGDEKLPCIFDNISGFVERIAIIELNHKFGYINESAKIFVEPVYEHACDFDKGEALVGHNYMYAKINCKGEIIEPFYYNYEDYFKDISIIEYFDKYALIDEYEDIIPFPNDSKYDGFCFYDYIEAWGVNKDGGNGYGLIDIQGNVILDFK